MLVLAIKMIFFRGIPEKKRKRFFTATEEDQNVVLVENDTASYSKFQDGVDVLRVAADLKVEIVLIVLNSIELTYFIGFLPLEMLDVSIPQTKFALKN